MQAKDFNHVKQEQLETLKTASYVLMLEPDAPTARRARGASLFHAA